MARMQAGKIANDDVWRLMNLLICECLNFVVFCTADPEDMPTTLMLLMERDFDRLAGIILYQP